MLINPQALIWLLHEMTACASYCLKNGRLGTSLVPSCGLPGYETRVVPISLSLQHTDDELKTSSNVKTSLLSNLA